LFGKNHGETIARTKRAITTQNGHQDAKSIIEIFLKHVKIGAI
jgi:hypothetical protein